MDENRNKIIVGAVIAVVVVGLVILVITKTSVSCDLVDDEPNPIMATEPLKSSDSKALATFAGYLKYATNDNSTKPKVFLPLDLQSISFDGSKFQMAADCAKLTFNVKTVESGETRVESIDVDLEKPNGDHKNCTVTTPDIAIKGNSNKHYQCKVKSDHTCNKIIKDKDGKDLSIIVANLVMKGIEFQLDGDMKDGKFSPKVSVCPQPSKN